MTWNQRRRALEHIQLKVVPFMIGSALWIVVVPLLVVDRNPHFTGVAVVQAIAAAKIGIAPEILRVVDVRIVVKTLPILRTEISP